MLVGFLVVFLVAFWPDSSDSLFNIAPIAAGGVASGFDRLSNAFGDALGDGDAIVQRVPEILVAAW